MTDSASHAFESPDNSLHEDAQRGRRRQLLARLVLAAFLITFLAARILVLLIMTRRIPDLFLHLGGTHVHHLNYGIFLLSGVGAWLLFLRPRGAAEIVAAVVYAVGLALTFDEFGMWLHLGGPYWQRASFDAVVVIAGILGLVCVAPALRAFGLREWCAAVAIAAVLVPFGWLLKDSLRFREQRVILRVQEIEAASPQ